MWPFNNVLPRTYHSEDAGASELPEKHEKLAELCMFQIWLLLISPSPGKTRGPYIELC